MYIIQKFYYYLYIFYKLYKQKKLFLKQIKIKFF
jgi:hypothetical protein